VLRHPFDVAVSFAHHSHASIDTIIDWMADASFALGKTRGRLHLQLRQKLLSWSGHVVSWVDAPGLRVHVVRYEDMQQRPLDTFLGIVRFVGWPDDPERVCRALACCSFARLQQQEQAHGFRERPPRASAFFRTGQVGSWRAVLTEAQMARIAGDHAAVMRRFGYLAEMGTKGDGKGEACARPLAST
jgi:hypothetical protein